MTTHRRRIGPIRLALAALALAWAGAVSAGDGLPAPDEIVVTAVPPDGPALKRAVASFARTLTEVADADQVARRSAPYCPVIVGLDDAYRPLVLQSLAQTAALVGVRADPDPDCKGNVALIFSADGAGFVRALNDRVPGLLARLDAPRRADLLQSDRSVRWWYVTGVRGKDGRQTIDGTLHTTNASLISTGVRVDLQGVVIVVDVNRASGYTLNALASFVSMVAFAQIRMPAPGVLRQRPSILGMFDQAGPRNKSLQELTEWDKAYLKALYRIPMDRPAWQQRNALSGEMRSELVKAPGAEP